MPRLYITGASCAGVTTLGMVLSRRLDIPLLDVDDFFWMPTDPPYTAKRQAEDRVRLIKDAQAGADGWVLTGSFIGWGDALIENADLVTFLYTPAHTRLKRLEAREAQRHGDRILPGGDMHAGHLAFREWAMRYDDPVFTGRSLAQHERWLAAQCVPVLRLDGEQDSDVLAQRIIAALHGDGPVRA